MFNDQPNKQASMGNRDAWLFAVVAVLVVGAVTVWMVLWASAALAGHGHGGPGGWLLGTGDTTNGSAGGTGRWSTTATLWAAGIFAVLGLGVVAAGRAILAAARGRVWTDRLASSMSSKRDLAEMTEAAVAADTERLGSSAAGAGVRLGKAVTTGQWLLGTYEWSQVWIMGTRAGKTRSVAVPQLVEHLGAAVTTSNKPDIVYLTRGPRSELGRCWIQDPQNIYGDGPSWWWNPLSFVTNLARAEQLAAIWLASRTGGDVAAAPDPYFEPSGRELLADLLLAAAVGGEPVTRVLEWVQFPDGRPGTPDPLKILHAHGFGRVADNIEAKIKTAADERSGIYGTARSAIGFLRNEDYLPWITRTGPEDTRPEFDPARFAGTTETLYLLSKESEGSARAITGALTAAVYEAAAARAFTHGGRLPTPILFVLDEAANVCRWPELPSLYSFAGSLGIILITIVQSRKQGEGAWGEGGFGKMWSSANVAVAGRGLNDDSHLAALATLIGDREVREHSVSVGTNGHRTSSQSNRDKRILTESDLRALPRGRGVLFAAGARPILLNVVDYSERPIAEQIEASKAAYQATGLLTGTVDADKPER